MINAGRYEVKVLADQWTAVTRDRSLSAQFEHSIGVTADGCEIFTLSPKGPTVKNIPSSIVTPNVLHYGEPGQGVTIEEGMFFTVEPMINAGRYEVKVLADQWTAVTRDRSLSAQFEHSIGVTADGCEIFTLSPKGHTCPPYKG